jgi:hypothetical protein
MTPEQTTQLVVAAIALMGAVQGWLAYRSVDHGHQLNGLLEPRIASAATKAVEDYHATQPEDTSTKPAITARKGFTPSARR